MKLVGFLRRNRVVLGAGLMAFLPLLCCVVYCALQGEVISGVYLPASRWNDEMFYFKQTEAILEYGYPYGYFGFNESHALKLSFAAWSPVLLFPWLLWGGVFGWGYLTPIYCNIFCMALSMFLFVILTKPTRKQLGILTLLFCLFTPFVRYMLSGMPEAVCFSLLIIFYGLSVNYMEREKGFKLGMLFVLGAIMTLMRPYLLLFLLLPMWLLVRSMRKCEDKKKIKTAIGIVVSLLIMGITLVFYLLINRYLASEYFTPLFDTTWVEKFLEEGIFAGIKYIFYRLFTVGKVFLSMAFEGFRSGLAAGARFSAYLVMTFLLLWQAWQDFRKKRKEDFVLNAHLALCFVGMLGALLLMYKMDEGSKHLLTFLAVGIFAVSRMETRFYRKAVLLGAVCVYLFSVKAVSDYEYQVPFATEEKKEEMEYWQQTFLQHLDMNTEDTPSFDNTVIWVFNDWVDGESCIADYTILYSLPAGTGINCCMGDYIAENFGELESKYMAVPAGGRLDALCMEAQYEEIGRLYDSAVYRLR